MFEAFMYLIEINRQPEDRTKEANASNHEKK